MDIKIPKIIDHSRTKVLEDIIIAAGDHKIVEIRQGEEKPHEYSSDRCIREASLIKVKDETYLALGILGGGHDAIELRKVSDLSKAFRVFQLKDFNFKIKPGFRSIISVDDKILASHSEQGIFRWHFDKRENGECVYKGKDVRHLNTFSFSPISGNRLNYFIFATESGVTLTKDFKNFEDLSLGQGARFSCIYSYNGKAYIGKHSGDKGEVWVNDCQGKPFNVIPEVTIRKPSLIYLCNISGGDYLFVGSSPSNLVIKKINSSEEPVIPIIDDNISGIVYASGIVYVSSKKRIIELDPKDGKTKRIHNFDQNLFSIMAYRRQDSNA
jgi:hypothetical protein